MLCRVMVLCIEPPVSSFHPQQHDQRYVIKRLQHFAVSLMSFSKVHRSQLNMLRPSYLFPLLNPENYLFKVPL